MANAPCQLKGRPTGVEPATFCIHSAALCPLSYGQREKVLTGVAGFEPAKPRGRLFEGQPALPFAYTPGSCQKLAEAARLERTSVPTKGAQGWSLLHCLYATPLLKCARRDSNSHSACFKYAASACLGYARPLDARGGSRTRTETLFERATSAVWVTRARCFERIREVRFELTRAAF